MGFARYRLTLPRKVAGWVMLMAAGVGWGAAACNRSPTPSSDGTAAITGKVLAADGTPLAGAVVVLTEDPDEGRVPFATVKTTAAGRFRIDHVPTGGGYRLRVRAAGHVDGIARVDVALPDGCQSDFKMVATVPMAGHIQDQHGTPIPLARVLAFAVADSTSSVIHEAYADERGNFSLAGLAPGAHRLLIEAPGLGTASAGPVQAPDDKVIVVLPGQIRAIVGRVSRPGHPARGARVSLGGEAVPETRTVDTNAEGRFAFAGLGPGTYALRAEAGGLVSEVIRPVVTERVSQAARPIDLALAPGSFLQGRVVDNNGVPLAGASVQIDLVPATGLWPPVTTDGNGLWTSPPLGSGTYRLQARHAGFVARRTVSVTVARIESGDPLKLPPVLLDLIHTGEITGRVVDDHGAPVADATIHDRLADTEELGVIWARLPLAAEAAALPPGTVLPAMSTRSPSRRATSDTDGNFVLRDVPPGRVQVEVLNAASVPLRTAAVILGPGGRLDVGTLRVARAVQVTGRVLDADERPVAGARVSASAANASSGVGTGLYAMTGADGAFTLPLSARAQRLTASASEYGETSVTINVTATGGADSPIVLRFERRDPTLKGDLIVTGTIHDTDGRPLSGARLSLHSPGATAPDPTAAPVTTALASAVTDAGGTFRLTGLPAGHLTLDIRHDTYAPYRQTIDLSQPGSTSKALTVMVPVPGGIDGEVHERVTGAPVPRFQIDARGPDDALVHYPAGKNSSRQARDPLKFSLRRLAPGRWWVRVSAAGYRPLEQVVEVTSASSPGNPSVRDLRLELERT